MTWTATFEMWAKFAPLATAVIAAVAAGIALTAVFIQRDVARRRAAIDFFLKTEMDQEVVALYERFKQINVATLRSTPMPGKMQLHSYKDARSFLNICELIAVGVNHGAFSSRVSKAYWGDVLPKSYERMAAFISDVRTSSDDGGHKTYIDFQKLCERWSPHP